MRIGTFLKFMAVAAMLLLAGDIAAQTTWQDVVYCKNGSIIRGVIIEQVPNESLKIQTADGNVFVYAMSEIEKMTKEQVEATTQSSKGGFDQMAEDMCFQGMNDAKGFYNGKGACRGATWAVNILTGPLFGLIPAAIGATTDLDDNQLNYPDNELWKNRDYRECYTDQAMKMKKKKAWTTYGVSAGVWAGIIILLDVATGGL